MYQLKDIFQSLHQLQVKYLLCGGMAVNLYGIPRMTADMDVIIEMTEENIILFEKAIKKAGYQNSLPFHLSSLVDVSLKQKYIKEKNLVAYSYTSENLRSVTLDVLVNVPLAFKDCWERRSEKKLGNIPVNVISITDLILLKEHANREQDKSDIINLKKFLK